MVITKLRLLLSLEITLCEVGELSTDPAQLEFVLPSPESSLLLRSGKLRRVLVLVLVSSRDFASGGSLEDVGSMTGAGLGVLSVITG